MERALDTQDFVDPYDIEEHRRCLADDSNTYLRIANAGKLAGFFLLALDDDGRSVEFRRVVITQDNRGIGQCAIGLMERYCKQTLGRSRIWLDVYKANARARYIYEKLGYQLFESDKGSDGAVLYYDKELGST